MCDSFLFLIVIARLQYAFNMADVEPAAHWLACNRYIIVVSMVYMIVSRALSVDLFTEE